MGRHNKGVATVTIGGKEYTAVQMLQQRAPRIDEIIPGTAGLTGTQLVRIAQFEVNRNPDLESCSPNSVMNAVYDAARLGLMLGREAHLVPYKEHCQMIPDFRGFITLAYRSGLVTRIDADVVFMQDRFLVTRGTSPTIIHEPDLELDRTRTEDIIFAYAVADLRGSSSALFHVMNRREIDRIRASSAMKDGVPWTNWYDRMAMKSAIKFLVDKRLPVTSIPGMADMVEIDNRVEAGKITRPLEGETDEQLSEKIDEETRVRQEDLKMKLQEEKDRQAKSSKREPGEEG